MTRCVVCSNAFYDPHASPQTRYQLEMTSRPRRLGAIGAGGNVPPRGTAPSDTLGAEFESVAQTFQKACRTGREGGEGASVTHSDKAEAS